MSFVLGACLLALAVPRTFAALAGAEAEPALSEFNWGRTPKPPDVASGIVGLRRAIEWVPSGARLTNLATLELLQTSSLAPADPLRLDLVRQAEAHFVAGLALSPLNGLAWWRLAVARDMLRRPSQEVVACLIQSLDMAPNTRPVWLARARLLLIYAPAMNAEDGAAVRRQLQTMWSVDQAMRRPMVELARHVFMLPYLQKALAQDAEVQGEFEKIRAALPPR